MDIQDLAVIGIIGAAVVYTVAVLVRKRRAFSTKHGCSDDCGCNGRAKKLTS